MADWKEILSDNDQQLSSEELLKYLDDKTPDEEKYIIEKKLANNAFENDAIDGLQQINNPEKVKKHVSQLNQKLHQQLHSKKHPQQKRNIKNLQWIILTILILLFICIVGYFLVHLHTSNSINQTTRTEYRSN